MKREALVARNLRLSAARHAGSPRQRARQMFLRSLVTLPLPPATQAESQRILIIRPDHLGDALLTMPAILALRDSFPAADLQALASPQAATVIAESPALHGVQTLEFPGISRAAQRGPLAPWQLALRTARQLRSGGFASALILRPESLVGRAGHLAGGDPAAHRLRPGANNTFPHPGHSTAPRARPAAQPASGQRPDRAARE